MQKKAVVSTKEAETEKIDLSKETEVVVTKDKAVIETRVDKRKAKLVEEAN